MRYEYIKNAIFFWLVYIVLIAIAISGVGNWEEYSLLYFITIFVVSTTATLAIYGMHGFIAYYTRQTIEWNQENKDVYEETAQVSDTVSPEKRDDTD